MGFQMRVVCGVMVLLTMVPCASFATDLPLRKKAPDVSAIILRSQPKWSGYQLGLTTAYGWNSVNYQSGLIGIDQIDAGPSSGRGFQMGVSVGHDQDLGNGYLVGLVGDVMINSIDAKDRCLRGDCGSSGISGSAKIPLIGTFRSRFGMTSGSNFIYVTSGTGFAFVTSELTDLATPSTSSRSELRLAGTLGAGVERQFGNKMSLGAEFLYYKFGDQVYQSSVSGLPSKLVIGDTMSQFKVTLGYRF